MKVLVDMNLSPGWVSFLAEGGFEAVHWSDIGSGSAPDSELMQWAAQRAHGRCAHRRAVEGDREALKAAPGSANAEQREFVDESVHGGRRHRLEHDAEQAAGARIVALPQRMSGMAWKRRMQHARDLRPFAEPARDLEAGRIVRREPHAERAQAPQREIH